MRMLTSRWTYAAVGAFEVGDAIASAIPVRYVAETMDTLDLPGWLRRLIPVLKGSVAIGLLSVFRFPRVAQATAVVMTVYFAVATVLNVRSGNSVARTAPGILFLAASAVMAARGPEPPDGGGAQRRFERAGLDR